MELLFTEDEKDVYRQRYNENSKLLEELEEEENPLMQTEFKKVNFKKKHKTDEFRDVALGERIEETNDATRETANGIKSETEHENRRERWEGYKW